MNALVIRFSAVSICLLSTLAISCAGQGNYARAGDPAAAAPGAAAAPAPVQAAAPAPAPADAPAPAAAPAAFKPATTVTVKRSFWEVNGKRTYPDSPSEGLLPNVRMANALFEDRNAATCPKGFDPEKNTDAFIAKMPEYVASGVLAFTVSLQGAAPGYAGSLCSAYEADGTLRPEFMKRAARLIEAADKAGAVILLGCFSPEQDQVLKDDDAVKKAVAGTARWIKERGYGNVLLQIADEFISPDYDRDAIKDPVGIATLIKLAKAEAPDLLVSTSGGGGGRVDRRVSTASDFVLLHFDKVLLNLIPQRSAAAAKVSKAIICNKDAKTGEDGAKALEAAVNSFASWGYANPKNETHPFQYGGPADDPPVYAKFKELGEPAKK